MVRQGLNCTMSYAKTGVSPAYRVRVSRTVFDFDVIAQESQARTTRAMYPRNRTAPTEFAVMVDMVNVAERNSFNDFLMRYYDYVLDSANDSTTFSTMTVSVPSRNFVREGVPKSGAYFGTRLGEMAWHPMVVFETSREPIDWDEAFATSIAQLDLSTNRDPAAAFFYPSGVQLYGSQASAVQAAITGIGTEASQAVASAADQITETLDGIF